MLIPTLIIVAIAVTLGALSSAKEKLFLLLVFVGVPAYGLSVKHISTVRFPFHVPDGATNLERAKDLFFQIPEEYRLGIILLIPVFLCSRVLTFGLVSARKDRNLSPEQIKSKKNKILKSYSL